MKLSQYLFLLLVLFSSCTDPKEPRVGCLHTHRTINQFQVILDSAKVKGAILIYALEEGNYYSNNFEWANKGQLPASTYKIPNSIIALETGVVENDSTIFKWDGKKRSFKSWEQDLMFKQAFHYSCVPCYQEVARKVGVERMNESVKKLEYGAMQIDSSNLDLFWLEGESKITQFEQIDFLERFYHSELAISKRTDQIMKKMIVIEENEQFKLSGKTGWSVRGEQDNGWFVGFLELKDKTYFFATNIEPVEGCDINTFSRIRKEVTYRALKELGVMENITS